MSIIQKYKAKIIMQRSDVKKALAFGEKINQKSIASLLGDNWYENPLRIHQEGLILAVDADTNMCKEALISETFSIEFQAINEKASFHIWNSYGVITSRPIKLDIALHLNDSTIELFKGASRGSRVGCWMLAVRENIVASLKYFQLDDVVSSWIINTGKSMVEEGKVVSDLKNNVLHIQEILKSR